MSIDLRSPSLYRDRELSWLDFNLRVLSNALREDVPVLERVKFVAIAASNLDEFYMVRIATRLRQLRSAKRPSSDAKIKKITDRARELSTLAAKIFQEDILSALEREGIVFLNPDELTKAQKQTITEYYQKEVHPILTPIAIDPAHPLPRLRNLSLNLALRIVPSMHAIGKRKKRKKPPKRKTKGNEELFALVQVPSLLERFYIFDQQTSGFELIRLEDVIAMHANELFPGHTIVESHPFRITRASDLDLVGDETENLLTSMQGVLRERERDRTVRLELVSSASERLRNILLDMIEIAPDFILEHPNSIVDKSLMALCNLNRPDLKDEPHTPVVNRSLRFEPNIFRAISEKDILLHHPYESFSHIVDFLNQASEDPDVVAIKQTFYRTSGDSPLVRALSRAAANGKQVTALVELKARFDEANNIQWARALEEEGVHVVYGVLGLKTHAKLALVIRREQEKLKRYLHLGTGNYNPSTAQSYTDLSLLTANNALTKDAMLLFNVLTGYAELPKMRKLWVAPYNLREHIKEKIERECQIAAEGRPARIVVKINSLADHEIIHSLYEASRAGVQIDLLVRGLCCLKPKIENVSTNIRVQSVIDRFLEHARVFWFSNDGDNDLFLSSADWMPRNLDRRIEIAWPILDEKIKKRICKDILERELKDNTSSWDLSSEGLYEQAQPSSKKESCRVQVDLIRLAQEQNAEAGTHIAPPLLRAGSEILKN